MIAPAPPNPATEVGRAADGRGLSTPELRELRHEVQNALSIASGWAQFLLRKLPAGSDERDRRALFAIEGAVAYTAALLDVVSAPVPSTLSDLRSLALHAANQAPLERQDDVVVRVLTDAPLVGYWHGIRIAQVLVNLVANAAKYSLPGTPITIELDRVAGRARVVVRDQGIGIDPAELEAVFAGHRSIAAQEMAPGSGIGLGLSRRLIDAEGGRLWATSARGEGSAFHLELPLAEPEGDTGMDHARAMLAPNPRFLTGQRNRPARIAGRRSRRTLPGMRTPSVAVPEGA